MYLLVLSYLCYNTTTTEPDVVLRPNFQFDVYIHKVILCHVCTEKKHLIKMQTKSDRTGEVKKPVIQFREMIV